MIIVFKLVLKAASAKPSPLLVPVLNNFNINVLNFCKQYNEITKIFHGIEIPVIVRVISVSNFRLVLTSPSLVFLLKLFLEERSLKLTFLKKILFIKSKDVYPTTKDKYLKIVTGTLKSMNIKIIL